MITSEYKQKQTEEKESAEMQMKAVRVIESLDFPKFIKVSTIGHI